MRNIPAELIKRYEDEGWWTTDTLGDLVARGLAASPGRRLLGALRRAALRRHLRRRRTRARRLAAGLRKRGVGPGDVIALQLPNWMEAAAAFWASALLGAVVVPIVHFYGRKEMRHIVATAGPRVFITAERFGRMAYQPDLCADVPIVALVGDGGDRANEHGFDDLLDAEPMPGTIATDPAAPALIAFTSGTTRDPKGVIHSHQTLGLRDPPAAGELPDRPRSSAHRHAGRTLHRHARRVPDPGPRGGADRPAPTCGIPPRCWQADGDATASSIGGGPPYFVTSLLDHPDCTDAHRKRITTVGLGGSTVPAAVTRRLADLRHVRVPVIRQHRASVDHGIAADRAGGQAALHRR